MVERLAGVRDARWFQNLITATIFVAAVLVGAETDHALVAANHGLFVALDRVILGIFVAEIAVKVGAEGGRPWRYFFDPWNLFDFAIVAVCFLPFGGQGAAVLRLARLLRVLKLVRALPQLQVLVSALLKSIPSMGYVSLLLGMLFYVYAVAGTMFFGANDPVFFGDLGTSLLSLFRIVTLEGWTELLYTEMQGCASYGYGDMPERCTASHAQPALAVAYFVSFVLIGTMVILNLFVGVIMNGMEEARNEIEEEARAASRRGIVTVHSELAALETALVEVQLHLQRIRGLAAETGGSGLEAGAPAGGGLREGRSRTSTGADALG